MTEATDTESTDARPYAPIDCDLHSEYEIAILHRQRLRLRWHDGNVVYERAVLPLDLKTKRHEEFLICRDRDGGTHTIRLDRIHKLEPA